MVRAYAKTLYVPNRYKNLSHCISHDAIQNREKDCKECNKDSQNAGFVFFILLPSQIRIDMLVT
jgi:hypothetical protein